MIFEINKEEDWAMCYCEEGDDKAFLKRVAKRHRSLMYDWNKYSRVEKRIQLYIICRIVSGLGVPKALILGRTG
jgi:hypothetical protein